MKAKILHMEKEWKHMALLCKNSISKSQNKDVLSRKITTSMKLNMLAKAIKNSYINHRDELLVYSVILNIFLGLIVYANCIM